MTRKRLFTFIMAGLLISNFALAAYIIINHEKAPVQEGPRDLIIEKLELNNDQVTEYDKLIGKHRTAIRKEEALIRKMKNELYAQLNDSSPSPDSLQQEIGKVQTRIEQIHFSHFKELRALCTTENQQAAFAELTAELAALFSRHPPRK